MHRIWVGLVARYPSIPTALIYRMSFDPPVELNAPYRLELSFGALLRCLSRPLTRILLPLRRFHRPVVYFPRILEICHSDIRTGGSQLAGCAIVSGGGGSGI
jgi:hypothetical protein